MNKYLITVNLPNIQTLQNIVFAKDKEEALIKFKKYHVNKNKSDLYDISFYLDDEIYTMIVKLDDTGIIE